jgi:hypothetical protein
VWQLSRYHTPRLAWILSAAYGMSKRLKITVVIAVAVLAVAALVPLASHRFEAWAVGIHQESTTRELAAWEQEFSQIRNKNEALRAVDMLRYVQGYYVPGPGYRSDSATEAALEARGVQTGPLRP